MKLKKVLKILIKIHFKLIKIYKKVMIVHKNINNKKTKK